MLITSYLILRTSYYNYYFGTMLNRIFCIVLSAIFLFGCKKEKLNGSDSLYYRNYFPLVTGFWVEYSSDSVVHLDTDDGLQIDTAVRVYVSEIREEVDTAFIDGENQTAYVILRYWRQNDSLPWTLNNVWTAKTNPYSAQKVEDNIRYIKMEYPIRSSSSWNGNAYNPFPEEDYSYEDLYQPASYGPFTFDSTVTVIQNNFISLINQIYKKEVYAAGIGMIYKQTDSVNTVTTPNGVVILNGTQFKLEVKDYKH
jgi:hypothetical protein